jgi:YBL028C ribosome biogenesis factor, N-terminal domain
MAKSLRSKTKRAFRRVKRQSGVFAAADAARLHRLSSRLQANLRTDQDGDVSLTQLIDDVADEKETEEGWWWFAVFGLLDADTLRVDCL